MTEQYSIDTDIIVRAIQGQDKDQLEKFLIQEWHSTRIVNLNRVYEVNKLPGFIAFQKEEIIGLITFHIEEQACEIVSLNSMVENRGLGTRLIELVKQEAQKSGCRRLWLITTNDNMNALKFYQKRQFDLVKIHRNTVAEGRKLKPQIPLIGYHGIPMKDEIELEILLG